MRAASLFFAVVLLLPVIALVGQLFRPESWNFDELTRWTHLAFNTISLVGLTLLLAMPVGILLAILLFRTALPFRGFFRGAMLISLFVPLPVYVSAWQMAFGPTGWLSPDFASRSGVWKPWHEGLFSAAIIHALAALPWVVFFVGLALDQVEIELEEDALTHTSAWRVLLHVSLRRIRPSLGFVSLVLALQTAGEITVTDVMLVRTFAEEVYNQYVLDDNALAPLILLTVPQTLLLAWLFTMPVGSMNGTWRGVERGAPETASRGAPEYRQPLAAYKVPFQGTKTLLPRTLKGYFIGSEGSPVLRRTPRLSWLFVSTTLFLLLYVTIPLVSLLRAAAGNTFSPRTLVAALEQVFASSSWLIFESLVVSLFVGLATTALALWFGNWAVRSSRRQSLLIGLSILLLALPSPVLGFGVKSAINRVLDVEEFLLGWQSVLPLRAMLYDLPSPLPVVWCQTVKFFPIAVALLLPAMNRLSTELRDELRLGGANRWMEFRLLLWPNLRGMLSVSVLVIALFAMSEIGASKLVEVPGRVTFAHELFRQMHYGATSTVAAFCLFEVAFAGFVGILLFTTIHRRSLSPP